MMRAETYPVFKDFSEQYKYDAIARVISPHACPKRIEEMLPNQEGKLLLSQLILGTLLNIYEITLRQYDKCTLKRLVSDIEKWAVVLEKKHGYVIDATVLGNYILLDILQNGGKPFVLPCIWNENFDQKELVFRLIDEHEGAYTLTDLAFDYIYKKRDIETSVERYNISLIKMKMRLEKQDFSSATKNAEDLLIDIRQATVSVNRFAQNCREGMASIKDTSYQAVFKQTVDIMHDIRHQVKEMRDKNSRERDIILQASENEDADKGLDESIIIKERERQRFKAKCDDIIDADDDLLLALKNAEKQYDKAILGMLNIKTYAYFDVKDDVVTPMLEQGSALLEDALNYLFTPMMAPSRPEIYDLLSLYDISLPNQEERVDEGMEIDLDLEWEERERARIEEKNERYRGIVDAFFDYARTRNAFTLGEFVERLTQEDIAYYGEERALAEVMMKFFAMGEVQIAAYKKARAEISYEIEANGQFNLDWCLEQLDEEALMLDKLVIVKPEDEVECYYDIKEDGIRSRIYMTDYRVEVLR